MKSIVFLLTILSIFVFSSCSDSLTPSTESPQIPEPVEIITPPFSDVGIDKVDFSAIEYTRPDTDEIIGELVEIKTLTENGELDYDTLISKIESVDKKYAEFDTMTALLMIKTSADITDTKTAEEYKLLSSASPAVSRAIEELFVSLANSDFAEKLEAEVFGEGFIEEYKNDSKYNDRTVALLKEEAELEAKYLALSPATVKITFDGRSDTYENILEYADKKYKNDPLRLIKAKDTCKKLYFAELDRVGGDIYVQLLRVRYNIAEACGYKSYTDYAYENLGHDYSAEEMSALTKDIAEYVIPVYSALTERAFAGYFKTHSPSSVDKGQVINDIYTAVESLDGDIAKAYSYMLNCGLYDIEFAGEERREASFTVYLEEPGVPFVFSTVYGDLNDYMTISHEFGHFYDDIINRGSITSLDTAEVSSSALELLILSKMQNTLSNEEYKYLYFSQMKNILEVFIFQGLYARFESLAYSLPYEDINRNSLDRIVREAAADMQLNTDYFQSLSSVLIIHLVDTPFYVQSYCTSIITALDIFFAEYENEGRGVSLYKALIDRDGAEGFESNLERAGLLSPFRENALSILLDKIYFSIIGSHYYEGNTDIVNAA